MADDQPWKRGRDAAYSVRFEHGLGIEPVSIWQLLERLDVPVALNDFGESGADGLYLWEDGSPLIVVNSGKWPGRQRFTAAHELGHHQMHRPAEGPLAVTDVDIFVTDGDEIEQEANSFAAHLLAPDRAVLNLKEESGLPADDPDFALELVKHFGLSYEAATWRLVGTHLITKAQREALNENAEPTRRLRRLGYDDEAAFPAPRGLPEAHVHAALLLYEDQVVTADRLAELLSMSTEEALALAHDRGFSRPDHLPANEELTDDLLADL